MVVHVVNHTSYHRGVVDEILGQMGIDSPASDFPVYLRELSAEP
ncbi:DinB family protein [Roseobacter sp. OBYS 0001]